MAWNHSQRLEILEVLRADQSMDKTIYDQPLPDDHPVFFKMPQNVHAVANDVIPTNSMLRSVYNSQEVMDFIAAVNGKTQNLSICRRVSGTQRDVHERRW